MHFDEGWESVWFVLLHGVKRIHLTVLLSATADGQMLPHMIFLRGKTDQIIRNLIIPSDFIVKINEGLNAWMGYNLMKIWVDGIWLKHTAAECKRAGFLNSMFASDAFPAHWTLSLPMTYYAVMQVGKLNCIWIAWYPSLKLHLINWVSSCVANHFFFGCGLPNYLLNIAIKQGFHEQYFKQKSFDDGIRRHRHWE